jgi:hypothetical protein
VPGYGELPWLNGVPHAVGAIRVQVPGAATRFEERDHGWSEIDKRLARLFLRPVGAEGQLGLVTFASRNRVISTNSVGLAGVVDGHKQIPFSQLAAEPTDSVATYARALGPLGGLPTFLITMSSNREDFPVPVTQADAELAAKRQGFRKIKTIEMPDGRLLYLWQRKEAS